MFQKNSFLFFVAVYLWMASCQPQSPTMPQETINKSAPKKYRISLGEWSLHRQIFSQKLNHLDFARITKDSFELAHVDYVSLFFQDKAQDFEYLQQMKDSCQKYGVSSMMIMVDDEGFLGDTSAQEREQAVKNHLKWLKAAQFLGCQSIRVNANGVGDLDKIKTNVVLSLKTLAAEAQKYHLNILVENHGMRVHGVWQTAAPSTNGKWLAEVFEAVNMPNCKSLPDFGNFDTYDRYQGVSDLMPFAHGISAKSYDFQETGEEKHTNYARMFQIIRSSPFDGFINVEYEGEQLPEIEGIRRTIRLVKKYY